MKYAFLTTLIPAQMAEEVRQKSTHNMQDAANALQWNIYNGLCSNIDERITIFNVLPIGSFPQYYKDPFVKRSFFGEGDEHVNIGFCNVKLIKKWRQAGKIFARLNKWCKEDNEEKTLFVYTMSAPFMVAVNKLKARFPKLKVCVIIADLPHLSNLSSKKSLLKRIYEKTQSKVSYSHIDAVDSFVLLTEQMAEYLRIRVPYVVMEGISTLQTLKDRKGECGIKTVLYTGTLHKRFGILNLVSAFEGIEDPSYRLVICGTGDSEAEIRESAQRDARIEFKGQMRREDILELQKEATVLVNPRQNNEEFTKYSFPSKNLEYLSSGVPLIAYKLDGIPDEYDAYINYVPEDSVESLRQTLVEICEDTDGRAAKRALDAARFVVEEKNPQKQTLKMIKMLELL